MQIQGKIAGFDGNAWRQEKGMRNPFGNTYQSREGRHIVICLTNPSKEWPALAAALAFRYKSIIGEALRARSPEGQAVEVLLACNVLNQMTARGRPVSYSIGR